MRKVSGSLMSVGGVKKKNNAHLDKNNVLRENQHAFC